MTEGLQSLHESESHASMGVNLPTELPAGEMEARGRLVDTLLTRLKREWRLRRLFACLAWFTGLPAALFIALNLAGYILFWHWDNRPIGEWLLRASGWISGLMPFHQQIHIPAQRFPNGVVSSGGVIDHVEYWPSVFLAVGCIAAILVARWWRGRMVKTLASCNDLRAIGPLAQNVAQGRSKAEATAALLSLLPRLRASDASLLSALDRAALRRLLDRRDQAVTLAILGALEQVGTEDDLGVVERLAAGKGRRGTDQEIREAAGQCLAALRERVQQEQAGRTLLRPSGSAGAPEDSLLRAAGSGSADSGTLLRPHGAGGGQSGQL